MAFDDGFDAFLVCVFFFPFAQDDFDARTARVIFLELYRKAKTNNPLFYFGSVGAASTALGAVMAGFVLYRWIRFDVGHEIIAVAATGAIILGIQLLVFGVLADMILSLHREAEDQRTRTAVQMDTTPRLRDDSRADAHDDGVTTRETKTRTDAGDGAPNASVSEPPER